MLYTKIISCLFVLICLTGNAQVKGKALNLVGTWKYNQGSGYETWKMDGDELIGAGYRTNKLGDSVKVEDLRIAMVNRNLVYTLSTKQKTGIGELVITNKFIGNHRKLTFENSENDTPISIRYKLGFFNKEKLQIIILYKENDKPHRLKLTKIKE